MIKRILLFLLGFVVFSLLFINVWLVIVRNPISIALSFLSVLSVSFYTMFIVEEWRNMHDE